MHGRRGQRLRPQALSARPTLQHAQESALVTRGASRKRALAWRTMDLHLHTPASSDYQESQATYLDVLQRAEARGLDIMAFTDHNTVAGYRPLPDELEGLELLERLNGRVSE